MTRETQTPRSPRERLVLVVGGAGYVGSVLVRTLLGRGYRVRVLDLLLYGHGSSVADLLDVPGFQFQFGDLRDAAAVERALEGATDVVMLASLVGDPICRKYPELAREVNEHGTLRLFESLQGRSVDRFVFTSTCSNYGLMDQGTEATEESALNPQSLYAETKVAVENHVRSRAALVDFAPTILRLSTAYGFSSRMRFDLTMAEFTRELALGRELLVYDEDTWRPYCHTADIARAIVTVLEAESGLVRGEVFNVGASEANYTKRMIVDLVLKRVPSGVVAYRSGGRDTRNYRVSFRKIESSLGFSIDHSAEGFVMRLVAAVRDGLFPDVESRKDFFGNHTIQLAEAEAGR
jgi:nucleoside-diphosphate-sugar epimerase